MRSADEINELLRPLARVEPGQPDSHASGAGARALLASIATQEQGVPAGAAWRPHRRLPRDRRRLGLGLAAAIVLAAGLVVGPSLLEDGRGGVASYANSAVEIHREGEQYVAHIKDPFADYGKYTEAFHAVGLNVDLRPVPVSPGSVGKILGMVITGSAGPDRAAEPDPAGPRFDGIPLTMGTTPKGCRPGQDGGCSMVMRIPAAFTGTVDVQLGRQAKPGEDYANPDLAMAPGEMFDGVRLRDGRPVDDVLAEARKRGLTVVFSLIRTAAKTGGLSFEPLPADRVGPDWIVWHAWQVKAGVIRLLVTPERLPENPFYNGSAPPPASLE
ncbi:hypothetical protein [Nonomuraea jiangxiensis]|uniref:Uncharacterized protein n=1 Tax=Nonomuraea jiangxiensis TaxID=633440 RepID=A0A1G9UX94_9ACTN|nr:hypothetical protein [Nonomuraea jiangxiensis]SDM64538.1 hypothetical protein SAMN05421869_15039 [Nonomuraea jiangxiensis]